jgi:3-hydroxyacyl-CoA dehydrogenase / enoyl-CoA hydratase / 3-hydroxybutyryl-CoA epimerase
MNVLTREGFADSTRLIDAALADDAVKGIVITSGKESFAGGMDLNTARHDGPRRAMRRRRRSSTFMMHDARASCARSSAPGWTPRPTRAASPSPAACPATAPASAGDRARLPPPLRRRQPQGADRPARDPRRHLPRRRRHHALVPHARRDGRGPFLLEGKMMAPKAAKGRG